MCVANVVAPCLHVSTLRRNYDLYLDKQQFATISGNFLAWEFELKDAQGGTLALLDRNFQVNKTFM